MGKEPIVVYICNWSLWRGEVSLLGEETWLARGIDPGRSSSWRGRSTTRRIGREGKVDGVREKPVEALLVFCQKRARDERQGGTVRINYAGKC